MFFITTRVYEIVITETWTFFFLSCKNSVGKLLSQSFILNKIETTEVKLCVMFAIASFLQMMALLSLIHEWTGLVFLRNE